MSTAPVLEYRAPAPDDRAQRINQFVLSRYLALSWTWCIGMFLPLLLIEDYGIWGWAAFAVPNVVGAAAMGWVVRDASAARRITQAHVAACTAFSMATVAFNLFFVVWFYRWLSPDPHVRLITCVAAGATYAILLAAFGRRRWIYLAMQWAVSGVAMGVCLWMARHGGLFPGVSGLRPLTELLFVLPTLVLGFAACPYLDLTFHWVVTSLDGNHQRAAFAEGFGTVFVAMILLTMFYAPVRSWPAWAVAVIGARCMCQAMWVAARHLNSVGAAIGSWRFLALLVVPIAVALQGEGRDDFAGVSGRAVYLSFLSMYALVFPAYVWIVMLPRRGRIVGPPTQPALIAFGLAVLAAAPFYWLGFFDRRSAFLVPGVAIVVVSRYLAPGLRFWDSDFMGDPQISLIVPVINEAENLPLLLPRVAEALKGRTWEMLVVDDDSTDATPAVCAKLAEQYSLRHLVRHGAKDGLGGAVVHGCAQARGEYLVVMDADLQHPPERLPDLLRPVEEGRAEFALGSRYVEGGGTYASWTIARRINSRLATLLAMPFSGPVTDPMSGFFAMRRDTYQRAERLVPLGYKIGLELMCKCRVKGVVEVPIHFAERLHGTSKLSLKEQFRYLEHLSRLYDFKYPRLSPIIKFMFVNLTGLLVWFVALHVLLAMGLGIVAAIVLGYLAPLLVEAAFHRRYILTQREFMLTQYPWRDFTVIAGMEWVACMLMAIFAVNRLRGPGPNEVLACSFAAATITRYVLRKELRHDLRGLRYEPRQFE